MTADSAGLTPAAAIDRIEAAMRPRLQDRRLHSRGAVYDAHFVPSGQIDELTIATYLRNPVPAVVRFSNGATFDADDREKGVRGMAVKFLVDGRADADLVAANSPTFPARTPEGFVAVLELLSTLQGGVLGKLKAAPKLVSLLLKHPETRHSVLAKPAKPPASFATTAYHGIHAFFLVDEAGHRTAFRYRIVPHLGVIPLDDQQAKSLPRDFLAAELDERLTQGPVSFTLEFQFAELGDELNDPTVVWPQERTVLPVGQIVIVERSADEERWQRDQFDPTHVPTGVELSGDPILAFRSRAYTESAHRRRQHTSSDATSS